MNRADYYVEILKMDSNLPTDENEVGRIVVTDLYNYAMPMIRYDTGDVGAYIKVVHAGKERTAISSFGGRKVDTIYDANGNMVSPHAITNLMWKYQTVRQFQFIQSSKNTYKLLLNVDRENIDERGICNDYQKILGEKSNITVEYCNAIPVLASGKRRYIVNEFYK